MTSDWYPYLLVRPCGLPFIEQVRAELLAAGIVSDIEVVVRGWRDLSRRLYFDNYGEPGTRWRLQDGAEAWLETTVLMYGDTAVLMRFSAGMASDRRLSVAHWLDDYKQGFRRRRREKRQSITVTFADHGSDWPIYFDGLHVPDPLPDCIEWELDVIQEHQANTTDSGSPLILSA